MRGLNNAERADNAGHVTGSLTSDNSDCTEEDTECFSQPRQAANCALLEIFRRTAFILVKPGTERQPWASPRPTVDVAQRVYAEYGSLRQIRSNLTWVD